MKNGFCGVQEEEGFVDCLSAILWVLDFLCRCELGTRMDAGFAVVVAQGRWRCGLRKLGRRTCDWVRWIRSRRRRLVVIWVSHGGPIWWMREEGFLQWCVNGFRRLRKKWWVMFAIGFFFCI